MSFEKSLELLDRALKVIPKGSQTASKCYDQWPLGAAPVFCESADGCRIHDVDGNEFIDHMMALGPIILGYNHTKVNKAVTDQIKKGMIFSLSSPVEVELSEVLKEIIPCAEMSRFGKNGSDVTSIAVRLARHCSGKELLLSPAGHYHGWADAFAAVSSRSCGLPECMTDLVHRFKYNDIDELENYLSTNRYAAVIMEPMALEMPNGGYLQSVRDLCDKYNTILIFDEMITGFRWSLGGAQEYYGVTPDLATFGKAISNGMPLAVLCGKEKYMKGLDEVFFSGTYLGDTLSIAAALATIKELQRSPQIYDHIWNEGARIADAFNEHSISIGLDASMFGPGPRHNVVFNVKDRSGAKDLFHQEMIANGIFFGTQIYVCAAHSSSDIDATIRAIRKSLDVVKSAISNGSINSSLAGPRSASIFKDAVSKKI